MHILMTGAAGMIGRKLVETMPKLMEESMELAVTESKSAVVEIQDKVKAKLRADGLVTDK